MRKKQKTVRDLVVGLFPPGTEIADYERGSIIAHGRHRVSLKDLEAAGVVEVANVDTQYVPGDACPAMVLYFRKRTRVNS